MWKDTESDFDYKILSSCHNDSYSPYMRTYNGHLLTPSIFIEYVNLLYEKLFLSTHRLSHALTIKSSDAVGTKRVHKISCVCDRNQEEEKILPKIFFSINQTKQMLFWKMDSS